MVFYSTSANNQTHMHAITAFSTPNGPCRCWFSRRDRWRSGCNGGSLQGVRVDPRWASFRQGRHGTGHGGGEPRSTGFYADPGRGLRRIPSADPVGAAATPNQTATAPTTASGGAGRCRARDDLPSSYDRLQDRCGRPNRSRPGCPGDRPGIRPLTVPDRYRE